MPHMMPDVPTIRAGGAVFEDQEVELFAGLIDGPLQTLTADADASRQCLPVGGRLLMPCPASRARSTIASMSSLRTGRIIIIGEGSPRFPASN